MAFHQTPAKKLKVQVWIYRDPGPEVLLLMLKPERGGFWQPVTGGVDSGEELGRAALREATEETGLDFEGGPHSLQYQFTYTAKDREFEEHVYSLRVSHAEQQVRLDPHEHVDSRWVTARDAASMLKHASNAEGLSRLLLDLGKDTQA